MFVVTEADAAAICAVFEQEGELSAAIELRRRFRGVTDNAKARMCVRTIAGWKPSSVPVRPVTRLHPGKNVSGERPPRALRKDECRLDVAAPLGPEEELSPMNDPGADARAPAPGRNHHYWPRLHHFWWLEAGRVVADNDGAWIGGKGQRHTALRPA